MSTGRPSTGGIDDKGMQLDLVLRDVAAETGCLMSMLLALPVVAWEKATPAEGWTVRDQVSHLTFSDNAAYLALTDRAAFTQLLAQSQPDPIAFVDRANIPGRTTGVPELLGGFVQARVQMVHSLRAVDRHTRVPWFGPPMSVLSFVTARLMETWAHGQDVRDALGAETVATDRLRHIADIGVRALPNSFRAHGRPIPAAPVRVEITGPSGELWVWGERGAKNRVTGSALDFCLVVTQRRHPGDTDVSTEGAVAAEWISIAQAFAGPPGAGRGAGQFSGRPAEPAAALGDERHD
ncbi:TIGR03084 family metal-binding protein [Nocardioides furvisabuli]|uniref:TIGR03084 family metal-binding protein n=2 Tax=Nocardioides furvisabuli TaxID=375542 RepID=A0ABN2WUG4_9ACTN